MIDRTEELVTVFGGGGFIGRYVCEFLLKSGVRVRVAQRNPRQAYIIQPLGQVGQFGFVAADITKPTASVMRSAAQARRSTCVAFLARKCARAMSMARATWPKPPAPGSRCRRSDFGDRRDVHSSLFMDDQSRR